jgi:hypothetical protein
MGVLPARSSRTFVRRLALVVTRFPEEDAISTSVLLKVFPLEPAGRFFRVSSPGPSPQTNEDGATNARKDALAHHVPVIIGPTSYFEVEPTDQIGGGHAQRGFDISTDNIQKGVGLMSCRKQQTASKLMRSVHTVRWTVWN